MELEYWLDLIKHYGPLAGLFLVVLVWQMRKIDQLLDRNSSIYESEIRRLAEVQEKLLERLLGPQPSSSGAPTVRDVRKTSERIKGNGEKGG